MTKQQDVALTVKQVSERLNMSQKSVRSCLQRGDIPGIKIGKSWRVLESVIVRMFNAPGEATGGPNAGLHEETDEKPGNGGPVQKADCTAFGRDEIMPSLSRQREKKQRKKRA